MHCLVFLSSQSLSVIWVVGASLPSYASSVSINYTWLCIKEQILWSRELGFSSSSFQSRVAVDTSLSLGFPTSKIRGLA